MVRGENKNAVVNEPLIEDLSAIPIPKAGTSADSEAMREAAGSAWNVTIYEPVFSPVHPRVELMEMPDLSDIDDDIANKIREMFERRFPNNPEIWRGARFERVRRDVLEKMKSWEVREPLEQSRKYVHDLLRGSPWSEEHRTDWEATVEETAGMDIPLEEHHVIQTVAARPPPGPTALGRGAFHIVVDGSGSMNAPTGEGGLTRWDVATAIVWTFIQEAKSISMGGLSHYIGIYGCDHYFFYPDPKSDYPDQTPLNPLPCGNILGVEKDFLRYWPEDLGSVAGDNYWQLVLPIMYEDYVKFGGGDFILIIDGDLRRDTMFLYRPASKLGDASCNTDEWHGDAADFYEPEWQFTLPKDPMNPTILMKLQKYMQENNCGTGYICWIIGNWTPQFLCPSCGSQSQWPGGVRFVEIDPLHNQLVMECRNARCNLPRDATGRRLYREGYNDQCAASSGCPVTRRGLEDCVDCRYLYLVLGKMLENGKHIFRGTSADDIITNIARTLTDQRDKRIRRGCTNDVVLQEGEMPYDDLPEEGGLEEDYEE